MKDSEQQILHAFLFALTQQNDPLPTSVQDELRAIAQEIDRRAVELDKLARESSLAVSYQEAYSVLCQDASLRSKGVLPAGNDEGETAQERDNVMQGDVQKLLETIQQNLNQSHRTLSAEDPVQQAKQTFNPPKRS